MSKYEDVVAQKTEDAGFTTKLALIVSTQLIMASGMATLIRNIKPLHIWITANSQFLISTVPLLFVSACAMYYFRKLTPWNFVFLGIGIILESCVIGGSVSLGSDLVVDILMVSSGIFIFLLFVVFQIKLNSKDTLLQSLAMWIVLTGGVIFLLSSPLIIASNIIQSILIFFLFLFLFTYVAFAFLVSSEV